MGGEWHIYKLGDLIDIKHGFAFKSECFSDDPTDDILLTPGNFVIGGGFKYDKLKYYKGEAPPEFILQPGNLLVTMTDLSKQSDTLGYPAFVPDTPDKRYLHNQRLGLVQIRSEAPVTKRFLYYLMCSREYRHEIIASATGTTVKHTAPSRIAAFEFRLPALSEQRAIAHILGSLDDKIELNRRMNETLEAIARAIFKSWFVDFDPVRAKAEGRDTGLPMEIADLFPDSFGDSELGEVPEGWEVKSIGEVVRCVGGATPSTKDPTYWDGGRNPFVTPKDMSTLTSSVILDTTRHITEAGVNKISSGQLPAGAVLLSSRAPIGYLAIAEIPVSVNQGIIAMICNKELPNFYVLYWTEANMETIKSNASGTTFDEISKRNFRPIQSIVPPAQVLGTYVQQIEPLHRRMVSNLQETNTLSPLRDTLLPKLLSGELRVPDAEKFIEGTGV